MKPLIVACLLLLGVAASGSAYVENDNAQRKSMQQAALAVGQTFAIPANPAIADPDRVYPALRAAADQAGLNVFRTSIGYAADGSPEVTHYALLVGPTHFFDTFELQSGRWLSREDDSDPAAFLSTVSTSEADQVGVLADFGGNDRVAIRSMASAFQELPADGTYVVETLDPTQFDAFINLLAANLSVSGATPLTATDLRSGAGWFPGYANDYGTILLAIQLAAVFLTGLFLTFQILSDSKKIGILRLHGYGSIDLWFESGGRLVLGSLAVSAAVALPGSRFVQDSTVAFTVAAAENLLRAFAVALVASMVACAYAGSARVSESVKGRKDTGRVLALNTVVKTACSVALITLVAGIGLRFGQLQNRSHELEGWERARGYGIFYPTDVGNDLVEMETGGLGPTAAEVYGLYEILNASGAVYVDATAYEGDFMAAPIPPGAYRSMTVNVNYLSRFPVQASSGGPITVSEEDTDWVVLVPWRYHEQEDSIRAYFGCLRLGCGDRQGAVQVEKAIFGRSAPSGVATQSVAIVWMRDQEVFSFDPLVDPDGASLVRDPIIQVMTRANSLGVDRMNMLTGTGGTALKVRLSNGDAARTLRDLEPTLRSLKLDDNLRHLVTMDEYASQKIEAVAEAMRSLLLTGVFLVVALIILAAQSVSILFARYSRRFAVRRLFGLGFVRTFPEILLTMAAVSGAQVCGVLLAASIGLDPFSAGVSTGDNRPAIIVAAGAVILTEWLMSLAVLSYVERRSLVRVLKQEF